MVPIPTRTIGDSSVELENTASSTNHLASHKPPAAKGGRKASTSSKTVQKHRQWIWTFRQRHASPISIEAINSHAVAAGSGKND